MFIDKKDGHLKKQSFSISATELAMIVNEKNEHPEK
jgi:hypothetical protein